MKMIDVLVKMNQYVVETDPPIFDGEQPDKRIKLRLVDNANISLTTGGCLRIACIPGEGTERVRRAICEAAGVETEPRVAPKLILPGGEHMVVAMLTVDEARELVKELVEAIAMV